MFYLGGLKTYRELIDANATDGFLSFVSRAVATHARLSARRNIKRWFDPTYDDERQAALALDPTA